jgi:tetratricopeptide (TPR) repeat protein
MSVRIAAMALALGLKVAAQTPPTAPPPPPPPPPATTDPSKSSLSADELKARELIQAGKFEEAVEAFRRAGKANPLLPPPRVMLADIFYQAQQGQAARQALERAAQEDPDHPSVMLLNASFAYGEGRITDMILSCTAALKASESPRWDPEQRKRFARDARVGLAAGYETRRDFAQAKDVLTGILKEDPKNAQVRIRLGTALFVLGKSDDALAEFTAAHKDDPTVDPPELLFGKLWAARPDAAKAEEWMKKAVAAHGKNGKTFREYAGWLLNQGRIDESGAQIQQAEAVEPNARDTAALKGLYHRYRKEFPQAEAVFEKMQRESPRDRFAAGNYALVLAESGDATKQKRAIEIGENLVSQNQKSPDGYSVLGWCLYKAGRLDDAQKTLMTAASGGQVERDTAYYLAKVLVEKNAPDDARKLLKEALAQPGPFVNRAEATAFASEVDKKYPPKPDEKKPEEKK